MTRRARGGNQTHYRSVASNFATSPAYSMNSLAIGLSVRFFSVMPETGSCQGGNSIGNIFRKERSIPNRSTDPGTTVIKRPVANKAFLTEEEETTTVARGRSDPTARKALATGEPASTSWGARIHGS